MFTRTVAALLAALAGVAGANTGPTPVPVPDPLTGNPHAVVDGPGNDYQVAVLEPREDPDQRIAVFERLGANDFGGLWLTRSDDGGKNWHTPTLLLGTAANERHPSLVQAGPESFLLAWLSSAGGYRIHLA
ncbi:MAG: hypothetical protein M0Q42_11420 [Xanthomonadales bacterium]|nr:hypothetical protein [Xanthomonadales bacterium]